MLNNIQNTGGEICCITLYDREDIITADVSIENLVIRNLSTFDTKLAHLDLEKLSLALELGIDDLRVKQSVGSCQIYLEIFHE